MGQIFESDYGGTNAMSSNVHERLPPDGTRLACSKHPISVCEIHDAHTGAELALLT